MWCFRRGHDVKKPKLLEQVRGPDGAKFNGTRSTGRLLVHAVSQKQTSCGYVLRGYEEFPKQRGAA